MKRIKNSNIPIKKDVLFHSFLKNKKTFLYLLILILLARIVSHTVLNLSPFIFWFKYLMPVCLGVFIFVKRYLKYKLYYKKRIKDFADYVIVLLNILFLISFFWLIIHIVFGVLITYNASKNDTQVFNCKIVSVFTINADRVQYIFKNKRYIIQLGSYQKDSKEIEKKYFVELRLKKSICNTYVLESYSLLKIKQDLKYD